MIVDAVNGGKLEATANKSFTRMSTAYGAPIPCNSMYRTFAEQADLRAKWIAKVPGYNYASTPEASDHPKGTAIDVVKATYLWMEIHARSHGWIRNDPNERWHYVYRYAYDTHRFETLPTSTLAPPPVRTAPKDETMIPFIQALYRAYLDREPSPLELLEWSRNVVAAGYANTTELENAFKGSRAEAGTARAAYARYLGRLPESQEAVTSWSDGETIAQVFAGVGGSAEARARR